MKTLKSIDWFDIALIALCGWWFFGWIFQADPEPIKLEGNAMWCYHSEYGTLDAYKDVHIGAGNSFIDLMPGGKVRVFVHCDFYDK